MAAAAAIVLEEALASPLLNTGYDHHFLDDLSLVNGGESSDAISGLKRSSELKKPGNGNLDIFGYNETGKSGVGAEVRQRITPNISVFGQGHIGTKADKPDNGVMGGIRFEW